MKDGVCSKHYPKDFAEATVYRAHGYPIYRRRPPEPDSPEPVYPNHTNRWVVPYNPYLLLRYQCHLNVEVCSTIKAVKYLYKYTYKGPDRAHLESVRDETVEFLNARYVTSPEACWRLFNFPLHAKSHAVEPLPVHLEPQNTVLFQ